MCGWHAATNTAGKHLELFHPNTYTPKHTTPCLAATTKTLPAHMPQACLLPTSSQACMGEPVPASLLFKSMFDRQGRHDFPKPSPALDKAWRTHAFTTTSCVFGLTLPPPFKRAHTPPSSKTFYHFLPPRTTPFCFCNSPAPSCGTGIPPALLPGCRFCLVVLPSPFFSGSNICSLPPTAGGSVL